ncbi:unnamed protein product [Enterobius vermicularis]|uniref:VWFA domain-containing protein n=1 Tax=Enterobius vermicularis TaxID=51028 RepID=A0A0N4VKQ5_ENTVE|nr:unnamed protein product [Enterobius vermicularis]
MRLYYDRLLIGMIPLFCTMVQASPGKTATPEKCLEACTKSKKSFDFICKSAMWYRDSKECVLNNGNSKENGEFLFSTKESGDKVDYYENICLDSQKKDEEESSGEEPDVNEKAKEIGEKEQECFRTYQNRSLVGFADEVKNDLNHRQCLYACYSCNDCLDGDPCNSVTYYRERQECILTSETKRDHNDLFVLDSETDYSENSCNDAAKIPECAEISLTFVIDGSDSTSTEQFENVKRNIAKIVRTMQKHTDTLILSIVQVANKFFMELEGFAFEDESYFEETLAEISQRRGVLKIDNVEGILDSELIRRSIITVFGGTVLRNTFIQRQLDMISKFILVSIDNNDNEQNLQLVTDYTNNTLQLNNVDKIIEILQNHYCGFVPKSNELLLIDNETESLLRDSVPKLNRTALELDAKIIQKSRHLWTGSKENFLPKGL